MAGRHEYLKDGIWHGKKPPGRFVGLVRHGKNEWTKTEPTPADRDHKGRIVGHQCCACPACEAWEAAWCPDRHRSDGRLFA